MCGPTMTSKAPKRVSFAPPNHLPVGASERDEKSKLFPLYTSTALGAMVILFATFPSAFPLNRGFTVWFHWASFFYLLTQSRFIKKVLILSGTSICLGWYACLLYEYVQYGRFFDALYKNMPSVLMQYMLLEENSNSGSTAMNLQGNHSGFKSANGTLDFESPHSLAAMAVCHLLDLLGHPLLTYYFWRRYHSTTTDDSNAAPLQSETILTWPVIFTSYCYSRIWSLVHTYHNFGFLAWFYVGHDVYVIDDLDTWYPAYIMETVVYTSVVIWKLTTVIRNSSKPKMKAR